MGAGSTGNLRWMTASVAGVAAAVTLTWAGIAAVDDDAQPRLPGRDIGQHPPPSTSSTVRSYPTTTTIPAERIDIGELPGGYDRVVAGNSGILLAAADGSLPLGRLTYHRSPYEAFGVGDGRIVLQEWSEHTSGQIFVLDERAAHELYPGAATAYEGYGLLDVGFVGGRAYALVLVTTPTGEEESTDGLVLVDLETFRRLELGTVTAPRQWVEDAQLLPNGDVVFLRAVDEAHELEHRRLDGTTAWTLPLGSYETARTLVLQPGPVESLLLLEPSVAEGRSPHLRVRRFDVATGAELGAPVEHVIDVPAGHDDSWSFCNTAELVDPTTVLCNRGYGPAVRVDLGDGEVHSEPGVPPEGRTTIWRQPR